jgi:hypothetical protein
MRKPRVARPGGFWARLLSYRPSAAMIVAMIALFVAMGGTTYAVKRLPKASVGSKQIRSKAVRTRHIKARNVTRTKIAKNAIDQSLVANNALRGSDILESSLGTVPSATKATTADRLSGLNLSKFSFRGAPGTSAPNVLNVGGLALNAACNAGNALSVSATTTASGANIHSGGTWDRASSKTFYVVDDVFDLGESFDVLQNGPGGTGSTDLNGSLVYARQDGNVVTVDFLAQETASGCVFAGTAIG